MSHFQFTGTFSAVCISECRRFNALNLTCCPHYPQCNTTTASWAGVSGVLCEEQLGPFFLTDAGNESGFKRRE